MERGPYSYDEVRLIMELSYRAGFIEASQWPEPVSQDVDSPAFKKVCGWFIDCHHPFENELHGL